MQSGRYPVLRVGNFFSNPGWYFSDLELDEDKYCHKGDLLYAWSASFGPKIWDGGKTIYHYHIWRTEPDSSVADKQFLYRWFAWDTDNIKHEHGTGSTMIHVTKGDMEQRSLGLPPLAEQRRIVAKLDTLTARLARARAELDRVTSLARQLRNAALSALAAPLPGAKPQHVSDLSLTIFDGPFGSNLKSVDYTSSGVRVIRLENIGHLGFKASKLTHISEEKYASLSRHRLVADDILFSSFVDRDVRVCRYPPDQNSPAINKADCFVVRVDQSRHDVRYITYSLATPATYETLKAQVHGATRPRISLGQLRKHTLQVPSMKAQAEEADRLDATFARAGRLEAEAAHAHTLLDRLEAAILARAFRGELVPQDPNDEPASVLLDRIRARRAAAPKPLRRRRADATSA